MFSPAFYFFVKKEAKKRNFKRKEEKEAEWDASNRELHTDDDDSNQEVIDYDLGMSH
jgi:hypothetical protein